MRRGKTRSVMNEFNCNGFQTSAVTKLLLVCSLLLSMLFVNAQKPVLSGTGKAKSYTDILKSDVAIVRCDSFDHYVIAKVSYRHIPRVRRSDPTLFGIFKRYTGDATFIGHTTDGVNFKYDQIESFSKVAIAMANKLAISKVYYSAFDMTLTDRNGRERKMSIKEKFQKQLLEDIKGLNPSLKVVSVTYKGQVDGIIRNNEQGILSVVVANTGNIPLNSLYLAVELGNAESIVLGKKRTVETFNLKSGDTCTFTIPLTSKYHMPKQGLDVIITPRFAEFQGPLNTSVHIVPCKGFFMDDVVFQLQDKGSQRVKYINAYFGIGDIAYELPSETLPSLVANGDHKARFWQAMFRIWGRGGYQPDEEWARGECDKPSLTKLMQSAKEGDLESIFLLGCVLRFGLGVEKDFEYAMELLNVANTNKYIPACLDMALSYYEAGAEKEGLALLSSLREQGVRKATYYLTVIDRPKERPHTVESYQDLLKLTTEAMAMGDCEAALVMAKLMTDKDYVNPDYPLAKELLRPGVSAGHTMSMIQLSFFHQLDQNDSTSTADSVLYYLKMAVDHGDRRALYMLGVYYLDEGNPDYNYNLGFEYIKQSSELNYPPAMGKIANLYLNTRNGSYDMVRAKYWYNRVLEYKGDLEESRSTKGGNISLLEVIEKGDFSGSVYVYRDEWGYKYTERSGPVEDVLTGLVSGWLEAARENRRQKQEIVNQAVLIKKRFGREYWAATISSKLETPIELFYSEYALFNVSGEVNTGRSSTGFYPLDVISGFEENSVTNGCDHGAFIAKLTGGDWYCNPVGLQNKEWGYRRLIYLGVNDEGYVNNEGYYDCQIIVVRK